LNESIPQGSRDDALKEEIGMKKYQKPSLKGLGLLRIATKFSGRDDDPKGSSCSPFLG
jgi:hypothetical protein